ncbi:MAG: pyrroloquinoline quinone biosynthesis protein PqqE [Planctomycetes bacterium]|nr:pyrroloquinoline quinone biosynthesis protein PqqE [Planctomycetota bacterium]
MTTTTPTPRPLALLAELTYRCPLACPYCSNPLELARFRNELDTATWQRVLGEASDLGVVQVHFSGGEPLLRRDLVDLVRTARELDLYSNLSTSAATATHKTLESLREAGLDALQISLLDADAAENDRLAGAVSFEKKQEAVEAARSLGFPITLNVVLHRHNLDRLTEIIDLAAAWQVDRLELAHTQYTGWAFRNRAALLPSRSQVERAAEIVADAETRLAGHLQILHVLPDYFQTYPKACLNGWGRVFLTVAPDGAVLPCQTAREIPQLTFPSVHEQSLETIWFDSPVFQRFRGCDWMPEPCRSCDRREQDFGGCRCQAFLMTGDPAVTDPVCQLSPQHHLVEQALAESESAPADLQYRVFRR